MATALRGDLARSVGMVVFCCGGWFPWIVRERPEDRVCESDLDRI